MHKQLEPEIKAITLNYLIKKGMLSREHTAISEFTLDSYARRVDLVIASDKNLIAIEIKSEADSLQRLRGQTDKYLEYFDKVVVVAATKHIQNIKKIVPKNVAIWELSGDTIKIVQRGKLVQIKNKSRSIKLMKLNELVKLSNKFKIPLDLRNRKSVEKLLNNISISSLRKAAIKSLKERYDLTSSFFWREVQNKEILPNHVSLLSPYKEARLSRIKLQKESNLFWRNLHSKQSEEPCFIEMLKICRKDLFGVTPKRIKQLLAA